MSALSIDVCVGGTTTVVSEFASVAVGCVVRLSRLSGEDMSHVILRQSPAAAKDDDADDVVARRTGIPAPTVRPPTPRPAGRPYLFWEWRFGQAGSCDNASPQLAVRDEYVC